MLTRGPRDVLLCNAANAPVVPFLRLARRRVVLNVDGLEWRRGKWGVLGRSWYRMGEWLSVRTASVLVTDAEEVRTYYRVRHETDSVMVPYGAEQLARGAVTMPSQAPVAPDSYALYVSRWERENNPLLVAQAHAAAGTSLGLVMLGQAAYDDDLEAQVRAAAGPDACLPGAVYGTGYRGLLANARCYVHATEVGGTHPALVEAMGAGNLCLVLDTPENREVAGDTAWYFADAGELAGAPAPRGRAGAGRAGAGPGRDPWRSRGPLLVGPGGGRLRPAAVRRWWACGAPGRTCGCAARSHRGADPGRVKPRSGPADACKVTLVEPSAVAGPARTAVGERGAVPWTDRARRVWRTPLTEHLVVLGSVVAVVGPLAQAGGGRGEGALAWSVPLVLVALAVTRPWRRIAARGLALVAAVAVAALMVLVLTGGGRAGAVAAACYGTALGCGVAVTAYARSRTRRAVVAAVLCAGAVAQFGWALVPWWGGADPSRPMVGTYDWHNQFAAALLAPALVGFALVLGGRRPWRAAGWVAAPLAVAGVVLSSSRATVALLAVGWVVVARPRAARGRRPSSPWRGGEPGAGLLRRGRGAHVPAAGPTAVQLERLPVRRCLRPGGRGGDAGPERHVPDRVLAGVADRVRHQPGGRGRLRPRRRGGPGAGPERLGRLAAGALRTAAGPGRGRSAAGPATVGAAGRRARSPCCDGCAGRPVRGAGRRTPCSSAPRRWRACCSACTRCIDTDWSYPALAAQAAVVAGVALAARRTIRRRSAAGAVAVAVLAVALVAGGIAAWAQPFHISDPRPTSPTTSGGGLS